MCHGSNFPYEQVPVAGNAMIGNDLDRLGQIEWRQSKVDGAESASERIHILFQWRNIGCDKIFYFGLFDILENRLDIGVGKVEQHFPAKDSINTFREIVQRCVECDEPSRIIGLLFLIRRNQFIKDIGTDVLA